MTTLENGAQLLALLPEFPTKENQLPTEGVVIGTWIGGIGQEFITWRCKIEGGNVTGTVSGNYFSTYREAFKDALVRIGA